MTTTKQSSDAIDQIIDAVWLNGEANKYDVKTGMTCAEGKQSIEKLLLEAQIYIWARVKLETDTVKCECGDKWSDSDLANIAEKSLTELQSLLNKTGESE